MAKKKATTEKKDAPQKNASTKSATVAGKTDAKATSTEEVSEAKDATVTKKVDENKKPEKVEEQSQDGSKEGQKPAGPAASDKDLDLDATKEVPEASELTEDQIEEIEIKKLAEYQKEVEKIDSLEDLEKLREAEKEGDDRKGAYEVLDRRKSQIEEASEEAQEDAPESEVDYLKRMRVKADKIMKLYSDHMAINKDEQGVDRIFLAKAWMGKMLAEMDTENPYDTGKTLKLEKDIPPTADVAEGNEFHVMKRKFQNLGGVEALDVLRRELEEMCKEFKDLEYTQVTRELNIARTNAYNYLCEAKFFMGRQLASKRIS